MVEDDSFNTEGSREMRAYRSSCSTSRVYKVIRGLSDELEEVVKDMGFGTFIGMKSYNLRRDLIQWLTS